MKKRRRFGRVPIDNEMPNDDERRLINALRVLAELDPGWMWWIEKNINPGLARHHQRVQVERQARLLVAVRYRYLGWGRWLAIVYGDYYFTNDGTLKVYL